LRVTDTSDDAGIVVWPRGNLGEDSIRCVRILNKSLVLNCTGYATLCHIDSHLLPKKAVHILGIIFFICLARKKENIGHLAEYLVSYRTPRAVNRIRDDINYLHII
jgi:hypothetical protein